MSARNIGSTLQALLDGVNLKRWDEAKKFIRSTVVYNEHQVSNEDFVSHLAEDVEKRNITQFRVDGVAIHSDGKSLGARRITRTVDSDGKQLEAWGLVLFVFDDEEKVSRYYSIEAPKALFPPVPSLPPIEQDASFGPLSAKEMSDAYHVYINSYNEGTMPTVIPQKWAETVVMNGKPQSRDLVPPFLERVLLPAIAGLKYKVEEMVTDVEKQQVFVRLSLEGVPENKNFQKGADGKEKIKLYEHAMYGFLNGKIARVWASQGFDMAF
ncbi:SnoaL-like polyketide cyclase [Colletotrichum karsti]|uniref:SnoaL-like polyketide cyclase n=1 Tax=Colletotrichum karsti TaxID=1095194 RepID=A0A9P6LK27_9PEZI|nr:SnoaL-like polyketide cyclase [Colletotrichum karsti]KAF9875580.1 SnoaL-like polyketide cyclase [Colletotrichum karsti]